MSDGEFNFNAPSYYDCASGTDDHKDDKYFDIDHELTRPIMDSIKRLPVSEIEPEVISPEVEETTNRVIIKARRRSSSFTNNNLNVCIKNEKKSADLESEREHRPDVNHLCTSTVNTVFKFTAPNAPRSVSNNQNKRKSYRVTKAPVLECKNSQYVLSEKEVPFQGIKVHQSGKRTTEPQPFSFELRDRELMKRKEEKINKYLEEEKKARQFHANPLPNFVTSNTTPKLRARKDKESDTKPFKAQFPSVLYKKPYEPKKPGRYLENITDIELNTERRAKDREHFDLKMKEKEMEIMAHKFQLEMERKKQEEKEIAEMRKAATHKAQTMPNFKPKEIKRSQKSLTDPYSPLVLKRRKTSSYHNGH